MTNRRRVRVMRIPSKRSAHLIQSNSSGATGIRSLESRKQPRGGDSCHRDVFYDGNEKVVVRTDARNPEIPPKKYKVGRSCMGRNGADSGPVHIQRRNRAQVRGQAEHERREHAHRVLKWVSSLRLMGRRGP